jgi:GT2 family glycosyltransferase
VSIVLPVLNEARDIGRLLGEIMNQTPPAGGFEVLVVDGGSTDKTREIVAALSKEWPNLRLLANPRKRSSAGRNVGAREASGEYVLFLDGHSALVRQDYLIRMVQIFESTGAACLCRPQPLNRLAEGSWSKAIAAARHSRMGHNFLSDIYSESPGYTDPRSAGAAYTRECFVRLGAYDERFAACEDVEFNHRVASAGMRAYRHPDLSVAYRPRSSLGALFGQMMRYGRGRAHLMARHPSEIPMPLVLITGIVLVVFLLLGLCGPRVAGLMAAISMGVWIFAIATESIRLGRLTPLAGRIMLAFVAIYSGLIMGFWRGLLEFRRFRSLPPI